MTTDRIGQKLGNYTIIQLLGQGGFAEVYLGEHIYLKSQAAVKILQTRLSGPDDMDSFLKEAQTVARLSHPHIIRVMDFGVEAETPYLVMDYAPKGTLRQKHPRNIPVPLTTVVPYVKQVADALQYAHDELRLIHRDIKPENMLISRRDEVLLSDFGIALVAQTSRQQGTQDVIGTVAYMAPEQIQGKPRAASDQYSLAVVVYEWLTGDRPFQGTFTEMCTQHIFAPPPPLTEKAPSLSPDLDLVVMQALSKDPLRRFENIQAFASALEQVSQARGGEQTEQMAPTFYSLLTEAQTNNSVNAVRPGTEPSSAPLNTPSAPMPNMFSGQQSSPSAQPGQFLSPQVTPNLRNTAQAGRNENSARAFSQPRPIGNKPVNEPMQPVQPFQQQVVLPAPPTQPAYPPQYPGQGNPQQHPPSQYPPQTPQHNRLGEMQRPQQTQYPPRQDNFQQGNQFPPPYPPQRPQQIRPDEAYSPQQQAMAPQRYTPQRTAEQHHTENAYTPGRNPAQTGSEANPARQQSHTNEGPDEGLSMLAPLIRPMIATVIGIVLFCIISYFHYPILNRPMLLTLAVPLFFGAAFGPIVGVAVGVGGIFALNQIRPPYAYSPYGDYIFLREHLIYLNVTRFWWNALFINGLVGFAAGLSMLRIRRYPGIGSAIRGTILGTIGLFGGIGFIYYSQLGLYVLARSALNIAVLGVANVVGAFAVLVVYSIIGRLLDPGV